MLQFEGGKEATQERDTNGDGKPDVVVCFDAQERPEREEIDKNGDQKPDVVRSYANGVLVREERTRTSTGASS